MSFICMKNIKKSFGSLEILHGVSLSVEKGEVVSIIGPSGAGKSTFLRCLNDLETIQGGSIEVDGDMLARHAQRNVSGNDDVKEWTHVLSTGLTPPTFCPQKAPQSAIWQR